MAPPPLDFSNREGGPPIRKQATPFKFLIPLIYAPVLPLIRISLRKNPVLRDRLFTAVLAGAFAHGFYLVEHHVPFLKAGMKAFKQLARKIGADLQ